MQEFGQVSPGPLPHSTCGPGYEAIAAESLSGILIAGKYYLLESISGIWILESSRLHMRSIDNNTRSPKLLSLGTWRSWCLAFVTTKILWDP